MLRLASALIISAMTLPGCGGGGGGGGAPSNKRPDTEMSVSFNNNGTYRLNIKGTDPDGEVRYIHLRVDGFPDERYETDELIKDLPVQRENLFQAYAEDDKGEIDLSPAEDFFQIPYREEAYNLMKSLLYENDFTFNEYIADPDGGTIPLHLDDNIAYVDFLVKRLDDRYAVLNFSDSDNIPEGLELRDLLNSYFIHNQTIIGVPMEEIQRLVLEFIERGYESDF